MAGAAAIGGLLFRSKDPVALADWYCSHLCVTSGGMPWQRQAGPLVFGPLEAATDYFEPDKQWMVNFRVDDLTALIASLMAAEIAVETRAEWDGAWGRFARIHDPEGNPVELWEAHRA